MFSININDGKCPADHPVSITDEDGKVVACHRTVIEAERQKQILEGTDMTVDPYLFARGSFTKPPTTAW